MAIEKGRILGPREETLYIVGEVRHLAFCGMSPLDITVAVGRTASSLDNLMRKHDEVELANKFAALRQQQKRDAE